MSEQINSNLSILGQWAQYYASQKLPVFPLIPRAKEPLTSHGVHDATCDLNVIEKWWTKKPDANIGIATGNGMIVLETDKHSEDGEKSLQDWCINTGCILPHTQAALSGGGGIHRLFSTGVQQIKNRVAVLPGVDIRASGGYVVAVPSIHPNGNEYAWLQGYSPADIEIAPLPFELLELIKGDKYENRSPLVLPDEIPEGQRNDIMFRFACKLRETGLSGPELRAAMDSINFERCNPPLADNELSIICGQAEKYQMGETLSRLQNTEIPLDWNSLKHVDFSDLGNSRRFAEWVKGYLIYTNERGFMCWSGHMWEPNEHAAYSFVGQWADMILKDALRACGEAQGDDQEKAANDYLKYAYKLRKKSSIDAVIALSKAPLHISSKIFDSDPYMLNTPAGIIDLKTGTIRNALPGDYCTQSTSVVPGYTEAGTSMWNDMLARLTQGDIELMQFLKHAAGMIAVGKVFQENCMFAVGSGRNGKSTFFNAIFKVLGTYATSIDPEVLLANKQNKEVLFTVLRGRRFVLASETEEGCRLSSSALKRLTSTDPIAAKKLYKDPETFIPTHTLVLYTNHLPKIGSTDRGTWNRVKVVPFTAKWADNDKNTVLNYCDVLIQNAGSDILNWIVEGAKLYLSNGCKLPEPKSMRQATEDYRQSEDWLQNFFDAKCELGQDKRVGSDELYNIYRYWAQINGEYIRHRNDFNREMESRGFVKIAPKNRKTWIGLCPKQAC